MAYIDKIRKVMDILNDDTFANEDSIRNNYLFTKALSDILEINKKLVVTELTILQLKSRIDHNILKAEDTNFGIFQDDYEDQIIKAKDCITNLNKVCEAYQIPPFYENDLFDDRAVMEFVNTFAHVFADARIKSYYEEKEHMNEKDLTKQVENEELNDDLKPVAVEPYVVVSGYDEKNRNLGFRKLSSGVGKSTG